VPCLVTRIGKARKKHKFLCLWLLRKKRLAISVLIVTFSVEKGKQENVIKQCNQMISIYLFPNATDFLWASTGEVPNFFGRFSHDV